MINQVKYLREEKKYYDVIEYPGQEHPFIMN